MLKKSTFLVKFFLIFTLLATPVYAKEAPKMPPAEVQKKISGIKETKSSWYIRKVSGTKAGKVQYGPYENKNQAIVMWIFYNVVSNKSSCIARNETYMTKTPEKFYTREWNVISTEISDYGIDAVLEKYFLDKDLTHQEEKTEISYEPVAVAPEKTEESVNAEPVETESITEETIADETFINESVISESIAEENNLTKESDNPVVQNELIENKINEISPAEKLINDILAEVEDSTGKNFPVYEDYDSEENTEEIATAEEIEIIEENKTEIAAESENITEDLTVTTDLTEEVEIAEEKPVEQQTKVPEIPFTFPEVKVSNTSKYDKEFLQDYAPKKSDPEPVDEEENTTYLIAEPNSADNSGCTLLMKAAETGNNWEINALLASGADVNLQDKDGWTALMYAVRYQENIAVIDALIKSGAQIKTVNKYGSSALMIAATYNNNPEILERLLRYYSASEREVLKSFVLLLSFNNSSEYTEIAKINIFLNKSIPLNSYIDGKTPLMYAAQFSTSTKVIKYLVDNGAITTVRSIEGKTALDYALANNGLERNSDFWTLNKK